MKTKGFTTKILDIFNDEENPKDAIYDPIHLGGNILICFFMMGALYWLLWSLLVFEGGIIPKLRAVLSLIFTSKTIGDFGYEASPYAMGVFQGWMGNVGASIVLVAFCSSLYFVFKKISKTKNLRINK